MRGADLLTQTLAKAGVKLIFSLSGNQIMPIYDACIDAGIRIIHTRHEGAAVYMAEAYAQLTGEVAVAMVTAGPGFASGLGPLVTARASESPILLLSGDSPRSGDGRGCFQELDQVGISKPLTKLSLRPRTAENLGSDTALALRVAASGRPGPVHLALPFDLLNSKIGDLVLPAAQDFEPEVIAAGNQALATIIDTLAAAERPIVLTGPLLNPSRAPQIRHLAQALDAPVVAMESPRGLKDPSLGNFAAALAQADVILSLGKIIDHTTGFGQPPAFGSESKILVVDPDTGELERARRAPGAGASRRRRRHRTGIDLDGWRDRRPLRLAARSRRCDCLSIPGARACGRRRDAPNCRLRRRAAAAGACLSAKTRIINGPSGCIGGSIGYALAAKIARPEATVIALLGDGTAGFHFSEFETARRYGTDFIAVIGHDARWNAEYQIQQRDYGAERIYETELDATRYDLAAAGLGCHGEHIADPAYLEPALSGLPGCVVCEITGLPAPSGAGH
jgi:acetolactate synthase-1/2/3 large subunit